MLNRFGRYGADDVSSTGRGGGPEWSSGRSQERLCYFDEKRKTKEKKKTKPAGGLRTSSQMQGWS